MDRRACASGPAALSGDPLTNSTGESGSSQKGKWKRLRLSIFFALIVFAIMFVSMIAVLALTILFESIGAIELAPDPSMLMLYFAVVSLILGMGLAFVLSERPLRPLREIMEATDRIAEGDYSARLDLKSPSEFRELSDKFNHMAEELESVEVLRTDFVSNVSHEFKTPVASIKGFAEQLQREDLSSEQRREYLLIIAEEAARLSELSSNVLSLSKLDSVSCIQASEWFNLTEQLRLAIAILSPKMDERGIEPVLAGDEVCFSGDRQMLSQVWVNLLDNAVKFSEPGGEVAVSVREDGGSVYVEVEDRGEEIPPEAASRIFDRFYQGDTSHTAPGNGLGLAIAYKIVGLHGGSISVKSDGGKTIFTVALPIR